MKESAYMDRMRIESLLSVMSQLFSEEVSLSITDEKQYLYYQPSKRVDLKIKPGQPLKPGTLGYRAVNENQKISDFIQRDLFGVPYFGQAVPFQEGDFKGCVMAIYPSYTEGKSVVTLKTADGWMPVAFDDVQYIEVKDRKTLVVANHVSGTHKNSLQNFEYLLPRTNFIRCHRSFIVNVQHIVEIFPDTHSTFVLAMRDGAKIPVSQSYSSYFRKLLGF